MSSGRRRRRSREDKHEDRNRNPSAQALPSIPNEVLRLAERVRGGEMSHHEANRQLAARQERIAAAVADARRA